MNLTEANLNKGRLGIELEFLARQDLTNIESPMHHQFKQVLTASGFIYGMDHTIVKNDLTRDIFYAEFESSNLELEGAHWQELEGRLMRLLAWLKQRDQVWADRATRIIYPEAGQGRLRIVLPRAKMPNNPSCGLHIHFHAEDWFNDMDHALAFVDLWNYAMTTFRDEVHPARYEKGDESYTAVGDEYAPFSPMRIPAAATIDTLRAEWERLGKEAGASEEERNAYMIRRILKWMERNRWTAMNLTKVDVRKDVEFRFMHGTLNLGTITHWVALLAALIEASEQGDVKNFRHYLKVKEPALAKEHEQRVAHMAKADTSHAAPYKPPVRASRAVRRLVVKPEQPTPHEATDNIH